MATPIDPNLLHAVFIYRNGALYRRDSIDPATVYYIHPGDYLPIRNLVPNLPLTPRLPERLSVKQIVFAMHHGFIPRYILHRDGINHNVSIENLEGTDQSPRWRGHTKQKQVPCRYDPATKQIVPIANLADAVVGKGFYVKKPN